MSSHILPLLLIWGAVVLLAVLTVLAWRARPDRVAKLFAITMLCGTWWALSSALVLFVTSNELMVFFTQLQWAGVVFIPVSWLLFALEYTGRDRFVSFRTAVGLSILPTITLVLAMTNNLHGLVYTELTRTAIPPLSLLDVSFGPWYWVHAVYTYGLLVLGGAVILQLAVDKHTLYRDQVLALMLIVIPPIIAGVIYMVSLGRYAALDPTPFTFVISGIAGLAALRRYRVLDTVPVTDRVVRKSLLEEMEEGVVVIDAHDRVVEMNPRARDLFGNPDAPMGEDASDVLPDFKRIQSASDRSVTITVGNDGRPRSFRVQRTDLNDVAGGAVGAVLVFHDVTEQQSRIERLNVLNRVLRHNLRNEMNVVYGLADRLESEPTAAERNEIIDQIKETSLRLVDLGDQAREIDDILASTASHTGEVPIETVFEWEQDRLETEHENVTMSVPQELPSCACPERLETILKVLDEALLAYNDHEQPHLDVRVTDTERAATICITDNGSGIPDHDRLAITEGEETKLRHGSGLALWLARWGAQAIGGDLTIAEVDDGGAEARLSIPKGRQSPAEPADG
jgi:signal transduction histidine kinase